MSKLYKLAWALIGYQIFFLYGCGDKSDKNSERSLEVNQSSNSYDQLSPENNLNAIGISYYLDSDETLVLDDFFNQNSSDADSLSQVNDEADTSSANSNEELVIDLGNTTTSEQNPSSGQEGSDTADSVSEPGNEESATGEPSSQTDESSSQTVVETGSGQDTQTVTESDAQDSSANTSENTPESSDETENNDEEPNGEEIVSDPFALACAEMINVSSHTVVSGNQNEVNVEDVNGVYFKITGNKNKVIIDIKPEKVLSGLCFFLAGNQPSLSIDIKSSLPTVSFIVRGNKARVDLNIHELANIGEIKWDAKGNQSSLNIVGDGAYTCPVGNKHSSVRCEQ